MVKKGATIGNLYKQTSVGVIPQAWEVKSLGQCTQIKTGPFGSTLHERDYVIDGTPIITVEHLGERGVLHTNLPMVSDVDKQRLDAYVLETDDIVFSRVGSVDRNALIRKSENGWLFSGRLLRIRPHASVDSAYLSFYFQQESVKQRIRSVAVGQTMASLNTRILKSIEVAFPPEKSEQFSIADVLSGVDALIARLEDLLAKKKNIKQGAMSDLLTGKRRLPGYTGKREVKKLGEVAEIRKGELITADTRVDGAFPVIAGGKTPAYFHNKANRFGKTLTISGSGASAGFVALHEGPIFASDCSTIGESKKYSVEFLYYNLQLFQEKIYKMQTGGAQPHIHPNDLKPLTISLPELNEQVAVSKILSEMDAEIDGLEHELTKYRDLKTGMMRQLLTGKIRLV